MKTVGVDIIETERIERSIASFGCRFLERVYTAQELAYCNGRVSSLAARWAAKEAVSKALGVGLNHMSAHGIGWREVEVLPDPLGKPVVHLSGRALQLAEEQDLTDWAISLSHSRDYAVAFVVASG